MPTPAFRHDPGPSALQAALATAEIAADCADDAAGVARARLLLDHALATPAATLGDLRARLEHAAETVEHEEASDYLSAVLRAALADLDRLTARLTHNHRHASHPHLLGFDPSASLPIIMRGFIDIREMCARNAAKPCLRERHAVPFPPEPPFGLPKTAPRGPSRLRATVAHAAADTALLLSGCSPEEIERCRRMQDDALATRAESRADHDARALFLRRAMREERASDHAMRLLDALLADSRALRDPAAGES